MIENAQSNPSMFENLPEITESGNQTTRLHKPTVLYERPKSGILQRKKSVDRTATAATTDSTATFAPKINKNNDKILENRQKRLVEKQNEVKVVDTPEQKKMLKGSDKFLLQKFNREFDEITNTFRGAALQFVDQQKKPSEEFQE